MANLAGGLLDKAIVHAMANPPKELREDYQFEKHWLLIPISMKLGLICFNIRPNQ
uniref:hypothetical protein n=1 Tax=Vibrio cholerae TaxID=666 RepID=UPI003F589CBC